MPPRRASAVAPANIAFVKYWGVQDAALTLPYNESVSMNLDRCLTTTTVEFDEHLAADEVAIAPYGGTPQAASGHPYERVVAQLDRIRAVAGATAGARVRLGKYVSIGCRHRQLGGGVRRAYPCCRHGAWHRA